MSVRSSARAPRANKYIELFDANGKLLERIGSGLPGLDEIAAFIVNESESGTVVREKGTDNRWQQRTIQGR
jgi:hypothetical protein